MTSNKITDFFSLVKRILLYQNLIYFSLGKFANIIDSQTEFFHKFKILSLDLGFHNLQKINFPENEDTIFRIFLIAILTISFLAVLNFTFMQFTSGLLSIMIGFIYYNPFFRYNELYTKNIILNLANAYNYFPSLNLLIYIGTGFAMIGQSLRNVNVFYYLFCCCFCGECDNDKRNKKKKKYKINLQFEFDVNGSNNSSFENIRSH